MSIRKTCCKKATKDQQGYNMKYFAFDPIIKKNSIYTIECLHNLDQPQIECERYSPLYNANLNKPIQMKGCSTLIHHTTENRMK